MARDQFILPIRVGLEPVEALLVADFNGDPESIGFEPQPSAPSLPILLDGHRVLFVRYAERPVIGTINPPMSRPLLVTPSPSGQASIEGMAVSFNEAGRVSKLETATQHGRVALNLQPSLPNPGGLDNGASASGRWFIRIVDAPITGGFCSVKREGECWERKQK